MLMEIPNENIKRLYAHRLKLGKPVDDYLKRYPSLKVPEKVEKPKNVVEKPKEVKHGKKSKG